MGFSALCGRWRYALRGILAYGLLCAFTLWCAGSLSGTWRTMFVAFLGLVHKVYACGMLAGTVIATTRVNEFLSAMARLRCPRKLTIPLAASSGTPCACGTCRPASGAFSGPQP